MERPLLSVIIPAAPYHADDVRVAAASALAQSAAPLGVEVIVCPDADATVAPMAGVTVLRAPGERTGPAATRNRGIAVASGWFALFLDADDYLTPNAAAHLVRRYAAGDVGYVYGDAYVWTADGPQWRSAWRWSQESVARFNIHTVTALVPLEDARRVGGFDAGVDAWEDWTLWLRLAQAGVCGERVPTPIFTYRQERGQRMARWYGSEEGRAAQRAIVERYQVDGRIPMAGCCGGSSPHVRAARLAEPVLGAALPLRTEDGMVRIEFVGEQQGAIPIRLPDGRVLRMGNNAAQRYADISEADLAFVQGRLPVRVVAQPDPPAGPPAPAPRIAVMGQGADGVVAEARQIAADAERVGDDTEAESAAPPRRRRSA